MAQRLNRSRRALYGIAAAACAIRLAFVLWYPQMPLAGDGVAYDQEGYQLVGSPATLIHNRGPVQISKGPIYPMFLAAIYRFFGHAQTAARIVQALVSVFSVWLIYLLADRVFSRRVAETASMLAAMYPPFISYTGWLLTETLSVFLLVVFIYVLVRAMERPGLGRWAAAGLLGGIIVLHREEMLVIVVLSGFAAWWWRSSASRIGAFALGLALTILPWTARNYAAYHDVVLVSPGGGQQLWMSTVQVEGARWDAGAPHMDEYRVLVDGAGPVEADRRLRRAALERVLKDPLSYLALCAKRIPAFWIGGHSNTFAGLEGSLASYVRQRDYPRVGLKLLLLAFNLGVIVLGFSGMCLAWRLAAVEPRHLVVLALPVAATALLHVVLLATLRYQVPIMPFLIIFAAFAVSHLRQVADDLVPVTP